MTICRGTIRYDQNGFDQLSIHSLVDGSNWEIVSVGDYILQALDLRILPAAFDACRETHRARGKTFYFCDINSKFS